MAVFARKQGHAAAGGCRVGWLIFNRPVTSRSFAMPVAEQPAPPIFKPESHYVDWQVTKATLRRVSLNVIGLQPKPEEVLTFLADQSPNKRATIINTLNAAFGVHGLVDAQMG